MFFIFFVTQVGQKPSKAKYYLDDTVEVIKVCEALAKASELSVKTSIPMILEHSPESGLEEVTTP